MTLADVLNSGPGAFLLMWAPRNNFSSSWPGLSWLVPAISLRRARKCLSYRVARQEALLSVAILLAVLLTFRPVRWLLSALLAITMIALPFALFMLDGRTPTDAGTDADGWKCPQSKSSTLQPGLPQA
jgi:hypothetical protein